MKGRHKFPKYKENAPVKRALLLILVSSFVAPAYADCAARFGRFCVFDPEHVVLEGDVSCQVGGEFEFTQKFGRPYRGVHGRVSLTIDRPISRNVELRFGLEHRSYLETTSDGGLNIALVGLSWRPFRKGGAKQ
jgi:hypothetical protein